MTEQYKIFESDLTGTKQCNPYMDVWLKAIFTNDTEQFTVNGFYCENGRYKIRFMPGNPGIWKAVTESNDPALHGISLTCECVPAQKGNHGRVLRMDEVRARRRESFFIQRRQVSFSV